jgi:hypothetical protein
MFFKNILYFGIQKEQYLIIIIAYEKKFKLVWLWTKKDMEKL